MSYQKPLSSIDDVKQYVAFPSNNHTVSKLPHRSSFAARVIKVPRRPSRRHYSSERINRVSSTTDAKSKNVRHITIRSTNNIRYTDSRTVNLQNKLNLKNSNQQQSDGSTNGKEQNPIHITPTAVRTTHHQKSIDNDFSNAANQMRNTWSDKNASIREHHRNSNRNKTQSSFAKYFYWCSCPHVIFFLFAALLLGIAIAAALIGSLINNETTTTLTKSISVSSTINLTTTEIVTTEVVTTAAVTTEVVTTAAVTTAVVTTEVITAEATTIGITILTTTNETVYGVWNTTVGSDSTPSTVGSGVGNYYPGETPQCAFDNTNTTKFTSFGTCSLSGPSSLTCGQDTGLYLTPQQGPSLLLAVQFCTGNDLQNRDPFTITIEGSNQSLLLLTLGSSWTPIYNGSTGLQPIINRYVCGALQSIPNNSIWYSSYRILVTSKRDVETCTQYSEVKLMGYQ